MSAYICSDLQFKVIASFASEAMRASFLTVANELKRENIKSVNYRYNEKTRFVKFTEKDCQGLEFIGRYSYADVVALIECVKYQSCEHKEWEQSTAFTLCNMIAAYAEEKRKRLGMETSDLWSI